MSTIQSPKTLKRVPRTADVYEWVGKSDKRLTNHEPDYRPSQRKCQV